jgi:hypothetical protein
MYFYYYCYYYYYLFFKNPLALKSNSQIQLANENCVPMMLGVHSLIFYLFVFFSQSIQVPQGIA